MQRNGSALRQEIIFPIGLNVTMASLVTSNEACLNPEEKLFRGHAKLLIRISVVRREKRFSEKPGGFNRLAGWRIRKAGGETREGSKR